MFNFQVNFSVFLIITDGYYYIAILVKYSVTNLNDKDYLRLHKACLVTWIGPFDQGPKVVQAHQSV